MNQRSTSKTAKRNEVFISIELWNILANHASELSKRINRKVTVDEIANTWLEIALKDKKIIAQCVEKAKKRQKK